MFESIKRQWREARGEGLRQEFEDAIVRLNALSADVNMRASLTLANTLQQLETQYGPLTNVSNDGKVRLAKRIRLAAKQRFTFDMGSGYGLALLSMHLESQAVHGNDGLFVQAATRHLVKAALEVQQSANRTIPGSLSSETEETDGLRVQDKGAHDDDAISRVAAHLGTMGYDLTSYGAGLALLELESGYNEVETASHIAHTTLALDVREAGLDILRLSGFLPHGMALLEVLKDYRDRGMIRESQWENDSAAVFRIINVDQHQKEWIAKILSDPIAGKQRLATSRIILAKNSLGRKNPEAAHALDDVVDMLTEIEHRAKSLAKSLIDEHDFRNKWLVVTVHGSKEAGDKCLDSINMRITECSIYLMLGLVAVRKAEYKKSYVNQIEFEEVCKNLMKRQVGIAEQMLKSWPVSTDVDQRRLLECVRSDFKSVRLAIIESCTLHERGAAEPKSVLLDWFQSKCGISVRGKPQLAEAIFQKNA